MKIVSLIFTNWDNANKRKGLIEVLSKLGQFHRKLGVPENAFPKFTSIFLYACEQMFPDMRRHVAQEIEHRFLKCSLKIVENYGKVGVTDENQLTLEETQVRVSPETRSFLFFAVSLYVPPTREEEDFECDDVSCLSDSVLEQLLRVNRTVTAVSLTCGTHATALHFNLHHTCNCTELFV